MKKILLTGSGGFIGKNIKESFLNDDYEIVAPRSFQLDLIDTNAVDDFFKTNEFDVVLHAGVKPGHRNAKDPTNLFYSNVRMFENLVRNQNKYKKLINFGSGAVYDMKTSITNAKEESIFEKMGNDDHSFCKYVVAKRIESLNKELNYNKFIDLNIFGIFGKYEDWEIRLPSNCICKSIYDLPITIRQNRRFSYLDVNDLFPILKYFIENEPKFDSYNVCPTINTELLEVAQIVKKISKKNIDIKIAKDGYGLDYTGDNSRLVKEIKNLEFTSLEQSLLALYNYYIEKQDTIDKSLLLEDK